MTGYNPKKVERKNKKPIKSFGVNPKNQKWVHYTKDSKSKNYLDTDNNLVRIVNDKKRDEKFGMVNGHKVDVGVARAYKNKMRFTGSASGEIKQSKKARNFAVGGPMKKKAVKVDNTPSYPSYNEFKDVYRKQGMNSDTTYFRPNPQNIRGVMAHNGVPADSVGVWSSRMNRELSAEAIKNAQRKASNKKACGGKLKSAGKKLKCGGKMKKK